MSSIDKVFKDGLDQKGLPYDEANWEAMEGLLDAKPRFVARYKYVLLSFLLMGVALVAYWQINLEEVEEFKAMSVQHKDQSGAASSGLITEAETIAEMQLDEVGQTTLCQEKEPIADVYDSDIKNDNPSSPLTTKDVNEPLEYDETEPITGAEEYPITPDVKQIAVPSSPTMEGVAYKRWPDELIDPVANESIPCVVHEVGLEAQHVSKKLKIQRRQLHWYVAPYVFYQKHGMNHTIGTVKTNEEAQSYSGQGLEIGLRKGRWKLSSGVQQTLFVQRLNVIQSDIQYTFDTTLQLLKSNYGKTPSGNRLALLGEKVDTTVSVIDRSCTDCEAHFNYTSIPVNLGYEWGRSRFRYGLDLGTQVLLARSARGLYVLDPLADDVYEELQASDKLVSTVTQFSGSAHIRYRFTSALSVWSAYTVSSSLNSMITSYDQRLRIQQVRLGLQWQW